jgi:RNA polymerase sigma-70 factor (ECF subfamily)
MARSRVRSHDVAEEVAQSVFVTVASKLPSGGYTEQGRFEPWLFRVTMNRIRDEVRRQKRHADPTDPTVFGDREGDPGDPPADTSIGEVIRLRSALAQLGEDDRQVIELRHQGGLSFKQIADVLDEPLGTVLARHHRALRKVRQIMEGDAGDSTGDRGDRVVRGDEA